MDRGYISLHRSILDHWLYRKSKPFCLLAAWSDMILKADYRTGVLCESYRQLAAAWGWTVPKVQRFLDKLGMDGMIQKIHGRYSLIVPKPELPPGEIFPGIPIHKSIRKPIHICIVNYWLFQKERYTKRSTNRSIHNKRDNYLFPSAVSFPKETITMSASEQVEESQPDLIPPPKKEVYRERNPIALHLASFLVQAIRQTDNGDFPHTPRLPKDVALGRSGWASTLRLMMTNDKHSADEIKETISWLYGKNLRSETPFVVMSPQSLRTKWDRIQIQMKRKDRYI